MRRCSIVLAAVAILVLAYGLISIGTITGYQIFDLVDLEVEFNATDPTPPKWFEQSQSSDAVSPGDVVILSALLKDDKGLGWAGLNVSVDKGKWEVIESQELTGKEALAVFRYFVPNYIPGTEIKWNIVFLDNSNNKNKTNTKMFVVKDKEPPQVLEQKQESDEVVVKGALLLSARVSDNYKLKWAAFETNESGEFAEVRRYNLTEKDAVVSMSWTNPKIKEGSIIAWRVRAEDSWGNGVASDILTFKVRGCPACPPTSEWSNCEKVDGRWQQTQIYYTCDEFTNFTCVLHTRTQECEPGKTKEEAKGAMNDAVLAIEAAKAENKDTEEAEILLAEAQVAFGGGDWNTAHSKALEAKAAAEAAEPKKVPGPNYLPFIIAALLIIAFAWMLLKFGKIHIPLAKKFTPPKEAKVVKQDAERICGVCGRSFTKLYTCEECGTKVCFNDARTWQGKVYCVSCLRKKGLI